MQARVFQDDFIGADFGFPKVFLEIEVEIFGGEKKML